MQEHLGFTLQGHGEHLCIRVRKQGQNTIWVAEQLAKQLKVSLRAVSWAGLKDRHALTEQWFSIHLPGQPSPEPGALAIEHVEILEITRHHRKLRLGCLQGNFFQIRLNELDLKFRPEIESRLKHIQAKGVPNYFGSQRFGRQLHNIDQAKSMFAGKKVRHAQKRALYLSAARSWVFNTIVSARVDQHWASTLLPGDCLLLAGSRSFFTPETTDVQIQQRFTAGDVHLSAPLWGDGELPSQKKAQA